MRAYFTVFVFIFHHREGGLLFPVLLLSGAVKEEMFFGLTGFPPSNPWVDIVSPVPLIFLKIRSGYISERTRGSV